MYMYTTDIDGEGLPQPTTRYTMDTKQFREFYLTEPWDRWAIGTFDSYNEPLDLPGILPSNQCHESWHKIVKSMLKGKLRGDMSVVLNQLLPSIMLRDELLMPNTLLWELKYYLPDMLKKAVGYLDNAKHMLREYHGEYFVLRFKAEASKISKKMMKE